MHCQTSLIFGERTESAWVEHHTVLHSQCLVLALALFIRLFQNRTNTTSCSTGVESGLTHKCKTNLKQLSKTNTLDYFVSASMHEKNILQHSHMVET